MQRIRHHSTNTGRVSKRYRDDKDRKDITSGQAGFCHAQEPLRTSFNSYGYTNASGQATVLQGDLNGSLIINHAVPQQSKLSVLLNSLTFVRADARERNVAPALLDTCRWLLDTEQFTAWSDENYVRRHHGFFWIKGKPGSGKSTLMKETLKWARTTWPTYTIMSYFFNARSPDQLEKSSFGMYRSMLHQLLHDFPSSQDLFEQTFRSKLSEQQAEHGTYGVAEDWTEIELQNFFIELFTTLQIPPVVIFIDALDEGEDDDIRRMVSFLERLTQYATEAGQILRICLSSRHYPHINAKKSLSLIVEDQIEHTQDIELYISTELAITDDTQNDELRRMMLKRSQGVFLWVVLVVPILNRAHDRGKSSKEMLQKLQEIPDDLYDVFSQILLRDSEDFDLCVTLLQWVLFSKLPVTAIELYCAIRQIHLPAGAPDIALSTAITYLTDCSRGLVEITKGSKPIVQIIHESVRDYLLGERIPGFRRPDGYKLDHLPQKMSPENCHAKIAEGCLRYILGIREEPPSNETVSRLHPLAWYAANYWWRHFSLSTSSCSRELMAQAVGLLTGNRTNLVIWLELCDIENPLLEPIAIQPLWPKEKVGSPLYYAALTGIPALVAELLSLGFAPDSSVGYGKYGSPLRAASANGHEEVVRLLLDNGADANVLQDYDSPLYAASESGYTNVIQTLLNYGADVNAKGKEFGTALQAASARDKEMVVRMLLDAGANVNAEGEGCRTSLLLASSAGHEKVVRMLLDAGADVNTEGRQYGAALIEASAAGKTAVVRMLLDKDTDIYARREPYGNALQIALIRNHLDTAQMLFNAYTGFSARR